MTRGTIENRVSNSQRLQRYSCGKLGGGVFEPHVHFPNMDLHSLHHLVKNLFAQPASYARRF